MLEVMRASVLVTLLVSGCFAPSPPSGAPCDTDEQCPSSQRCIVGVCQKGGGGGGPDAADGDGGTTDGPPNDVDNDGILNTADNCPSLGNMDQHDEDADGLGDVCDNCPHLTNANQANGDADGVGDACDPRPTTAGDTIARFLSFHVIPTDVSTPLGSWTVANDLYRNASNFNDAEFTVAGTRDKIVVEIAGTVEQVQGESWLVVSAGEYGMPSKFYNCGYLDYPAMGGDPADFYNNLIEYYDGDVFDLRASNKHPQRLAGAFTIRMAADSVANQVRCTTIDARQTANTQDGQANNLQPGYVGVKTYGATFALRYMIIFAQL
jgi:hypothetical protein